MSLRRNDRGNRASLIVVAAVIVLAAAVVAIYIIGSAGKKPPAVPGVETQAQPDEAAADGMINGEKYDGEKNPDGVLSYRINSVIVISGGEGEFLIENPPKNTCLMTARFELDGGAIYQSGYIFPNQHIKTDRLDETPPPGEYTVKVIFEGVSPETLESLGVSETEIELVVE